MKTLAFLMAPLLVAGAAAPPGIDLLITAARGVPGEFAADSLIRIAALDSVDRDRRIELLEQAFERSAAAQQPYKRIVAFTRMPGSSGYLKKLYAQELDGLSLRLRAVEGMLPLDSRKSRGLFGRVPELRLPRVTCDEFLVYDVDRYYDVLGKILRDADAAERARLLGRAAEAAGSPVQLEGMARVLAAAALPDAEFQTLVQLFAKSLARVAGDDRSFTYSRGVGKQIEALKAECQRRKISPLPLLESYRVYLVFNLSARRCADNDLMQEGGMQVFALKADDAERPQVVDFAAFFNEKLRMAPLQPIQELESTPARLEGAATGLRICQDPQCQTIAGLYNQLVFAPEMQVIPPTGRNTAEWQKKFEDVLTALASWKESAHTTPAEFYREKAVVYLELLGLTPLAQRERVLHTMVAFMSQNPLQKSNRMEWFLPVNGLIGRFGLDPAGLGKFAGELDASGDPVMALYARLEALAPRPADRILPLL